MDELIETHHDFDTAAIDFPAVLRRFQAINAARLGRTRDALRERQREFLELLPLLFEVNHPILPGWASRAVPAGISGYDPDPATLHLARRVAKSFQFRKQMQGSFPITGLYLMGSPGTVAYSEESDFDIWLCHDGSLDLEQVDLLQQKARAVESWAAGLGLEVHFFLINSDTFRHGEDRQLSSESSGSAQHNLLLEEFYRTGILVAGRFPLWWLVPPQYEADYEAVVAELKLRRFPAAREAIDFGGLAHVAAEEFFGGAVWQLSKGIDSPYKSALKLLLMEAYAAEYPYINLLSRTYKEAIYAGEEELDKLDPYLMMLDKVERYLRGRDDRERLELARRCFYFKVNDRMTEEGYAREGWRYDLLNSRTRAWGWSRADLMLMDTRDRWKVPQVVDERRTLFEALAASYRFLSDFARRYAGMAMISQRDLTVLGRKLYSAYERKAGKVELLNRGIGADLHESHVTLHEVPDEQRQGVWFLYTGVVNADRVRQEKPLKRMRSVVELAAWCYFNGIIDQNTSVAVYQRGSGLAAKDLAALAGYLRSQFPLRLLEQDNIEEFARPARIVKAVLFVNMGVGATDRALLAKETGNIGSMDAFSFGVNGENLVINVDQVTVTSWHEVMSHRYSGARGLLDCLRDYLKWSPPSKGQAPPPVAAFGLSMYKGLTVSHRVEELFNDVVACYYGGKSPLTTRYVVALGRGFYVLHIEGDTLRYKAVESFTGLLSYLGRPQPAYSPVVIDRQALTNTVLPLVYSRNKPGYVQLFYRQNGAEVEVFVLDERGSLFYQRTAFFSATALVNQFSRFFETVLNRMNLLMQEGETVAGAEGVEFFAINRDPVGRWVLDRKAPEFSMRDKQYFDLQVMVDQDETGKTLFTLYCDQVEFSTLEYAGGLFDAVVRHVLELRKSGHSYPIYITDISMARAVLGEQSAARLQTVQFLAYKRRIEDQLNRSMQLRS